MFHVAYVNGSEALTDLQAKQLHKVLAMIVSASPVGGVRFHHFADAAFVEVAALYAQSAALVDHGSPTTLSADRALSEALANVEEAADFLIVPAKNTVDGPRAPSGPALALTRRAQMRGTPVVMITRG